MPLRVAGGGGGTGNGVGAAGGAGQRCRARPPGGEGIAGRARMAPNARALTAHAAAEHRTTNQGRPHSGETERGTNRKTRRRMFGRSAARATARCAALARAHLRTAPQQRFVRRRRADYCSAKFACTRSRAVTLDSARARARPRASHARCSLCALKLRSYGRAFLTGLGGVRGFRLSSPPRSAAPQLFPR